VSIVRLDWTLGPWTLGLFCGPTFEPLYFLVMILNLATDLRSNFNDHTEKILTKISRNGFESRYK